MAKEWELAKLIIDAKKNVDSMWYIAENVPIIANINLRDREYSILQNFYVNCCAVLDKSFPKRKKKLCAEDKVIDRIYYERDKKYAHKDDDYEPVPFQSLLELTERLKSQLIYVREKCATYLPKELTLDFVPYDRELFRLINGLTADKEEEIKRKKYIGYGQTIPEGNDTLTFKPLYDTDDLKRLPEEERKKYCVIIENGLNSYEGLQNRQDSCIKANLLYGQKMWVKPNANALKMVQELKRYGFMDQYEILRVDKLNDEKGIALFNTIINTGVK